jgi:hypothetical protein
MTEPVEITVLMAGLTLGVGLSFKTIKWGIDLFSRKWGGTERRNDVDGNEDGARKKYLSVEDHEMICTMSSKPILDSIVRLEAEIVKSNVRLGAEIVKSNEERVSEVRRIFDKIDGWQLYMSKQGERIASLEAKSYGK